MEFALIVSQNEKAVSYLKEILSRNNFIRIESVSSGGKARRLFLEKEFDLCIIDTPLMDEFGEKLARNVADKYSCQVILLVKNEIGDEVIANVEDYGVFTLIKPFPKEILLNVLKTASVVSRKIKRLEDKNESLQKKIEDIKIVDKAKCLLIEIELLNEQQAHKMIERLAMDERKTKRQIAEEIIGRYEKHV